MYISDLANLSAQEKLRAMETLWDSLSHENDASIPSPTWNAPELSSQYRAFKIGEQEINSWEFANLSLHKRNL